MGSVRIAETRARAGLKMGTKTVRRIVREKGGPKPVATAAAPPRRRRFRARYPGHTWHLDLSSGKLRVSPIAVASLCNIEVTDIRAHAKGARSATAGGCPVTALPAFNPVMGAARHRRNCWTIRRRTAGQSTRPFYWAAFVAAGEWR